MLKEPGMMLVLSYFVLLIVNSVVLYLANTFFPNNVVLGTANIPYLWAIKHSMGALALVGAFVIPFVRVLEKERKKNFTTTEWMLLYFIINTAGIWVIARFAEQFGLGISSWRVAVLLGLVLDFVQGFAMMRLEKMKSN